MIIEFKPRPPDEPPESLDGPATLKQREYGKECLHGKTFVSEQERTISCRDCSAVLDPIAVVAGWARSWDRVRWAVRHEKELDASIRAWHEAGGRIVIRPSGVVVEIDGKRWSSSCGGGTTEQLRSALQSGQYWLRARERHKQPPNNPGAA